MNFTKNFKWQLVAAALGFSLMLTARAGAQEIVNTDFSTPSTSVAGNFNTTAPAAEYANADMAPQSVYTPANALAIRANNDMQQLNALNMPREEGMFVAMAILFLCCVSYAVAKKVIENHRDDRRANWSSSPVRAKRLPSHKPQPLHS